MRILPLAVAALTLAGGGIAHATHSEGTPPPFVGSPPPMNLVAGTGQSANLLVHVNVQDRIPAANPLNGIAWFQTLPAGVRQQGPPTCLRVSLNRATIGFRDQFTGSGWTIFIEDNGEPGSGDKMDVAPDASPETCPTPITPAQLVEQGNFVVHD